MFSVTLLSANKSRTVNPLLQSRVFKYTDTFASSMSDITYNFETNDTAPLGVHAIRTFGVLWCF